MKKYLFLLFISLFAIVNKANSTKIDEVYYTITNHIVSVFQKATSPEVAERLYKDYGYQYDREDNSSAFIHPEMKSECVIFWPNGPKRNQRFIRINCMIFGAMTDDEFRQYVEKAYKGNGWLTKRDQDGAYLAGKIISGIEYRALIKHFPSPATDRIQFIEATFTQAKPTTQSGTSNASGQTTAQYIDLGLPSGTKWKNVNEPGMYTYTEAYKKYGNKLPSIQQIDELVKYCTWSLEDKNNAMKATGPNGKYILFPLDGFISCEGIEYDKWIRGCYWSSKKSDQNNAHWLKISINISDIGRYINQRICTKQSVRLVQ